MDLGLLKAAITDQNLELTEPQVALLGLYHDLRNEWNEKLNLTRHSDYEKFVARDVVDSLAFAEFLRPGERVLDLGTGGGVPGVVLAVVRPDLKISLSESVEKRARAIADIVDRMGLGARVPVHMRRGEEVLAQKRFDTVVVRAVARLAKLLRWVGPHWDRFQRLLAVKGPAWVEERGEARHFGLMHGLALRRLKSYPLPGTRSESVVLQICPEERLKDFAPPPGTAAGEA